MKLKYVITFILVATLLASIPAIYASAHTTQWTIPTFSIVSVVTDSSVTVRTYNFPANTTFTVRMGNYGTAALGGKVVGSTDSGSGGSFTAKYDIPGSLKGQYRIAIRMDATSGGWFAFNWFFNKTSTGGPTSTPGATSTVNPTFSIQSVIVDSSVTIKTHNFPANKTFTVRMGNYGTAAIGGIVVGSTDSGSGGSFTAKYDIPGSLKGLSRIAIRMDATSGGWFAYNWFYNNTTGGPTPMPGPTSVPIFTGIPTFSIQSMVRNNTVTIRTNNFPAGKTFTVRMGVFGTRAIGGTVVGTTDSGSGGSFTKTYDIPSGLQGLSRIAIRMDLPDGFFAYNWFWNSTTP